MTIFRFAIAAALSGLVAFGGASQSFAQDNYPSRPIRVVVGFAAGGGNDLFARLVGQQFEKNIGGTVVIDNKPGAGGRLSAELVARAPADGYTLLVGASGAMSIGPAIYPNLNYHPTKSLVPLAMIASFPLVLVVPAGHPAKNVTELVAWAKANPKEANYATSSPAFTIATELFKLKTGMQAQAIPYKSSNESNMSVVGAQTFMAISDGPPAIPLVKGGQTRALAVTGAERSPELPDVPHMAELGLPEVNTKLWSGFFAPLGTPEPIVRKLQAELARAIADPMVAEKLKAMAVTPGGPTGEAFAKSIDADIENYVSVVKAADLKFEQ